jgi:Uma2 family endonuclease
MPCAMLPNMSSARHEWDLPQPPVGWELGETLPTSLLHDEIVTLLRAILTHWAARFHPEMLVARELGVRWERERPANGVDPDVAIFPSRPPDEHVRSMCTWKVGHTRPFFAVEVVSDTEPRKDYAIAPEKYAASGVRELVVFDPMLAGPKSLGPFSLQVWRRDENGAFARVYAGEGPAYSETLGAHLVVVEETRATTAGEPGRRLRLADDPGGEHLWLTAEEAARAAAEAARARIAELEAELARRGPASTE